MTKDIQYKGYKIADVAKGKADWYMFTDLCKGCGLCMVKCPKKCLSWSKEVGLYQTPCVEPNPDESQISSLVSYLRCDINHEIDFEASLALFFHFYQFLYAFAQ